MYLLGFPRIGCNRASGSPAVDVRKLCHNGNDQCICVGSNGTAGAAVDASVDAVPGRAFDWDTDAARLLERAEAHLLAVHAFGIVECFAQSLVSISRYFGWKAAQAAGIAKSHSRRRAKPSGADSWASDFGADFVEEIEQVNAVDMQLLEFARGLFEERTGAVCAKAATEE
jgi:hypothetical protein